MSIRNIRHHPPTDNDVVDFLTNSFPDLYLAPGNFGPEAVCWGETRSGRGEASKEEIQVNCRLVQLWSQAAYTPMAVGPSQLWLMFIATFLHELGHSSLVWYGMGACDSPQLGGIEKEGGEYIEKAFLGGVTCAEFKLEPIMSLVEIGITKNGLFYTIGDKLATTLTALDPSKGLPLLDISTLPPAPPATLGHIRAKFSRAMTTTIQHGELSVPKKLSETRARPLLKNDKVRVMPRLPSV